MRKKALWIAVYISIDQVRKGKGKRHVSQLLSFFFHWHSVVCDLRVRIVSKRHARSSMFTIIFKDGTTHAIW